MNKKINEIKGLPSRVQTLKFELDSEDQKIANKINLLYYVVADFMDMDKVDEKFIRSTIESIFDRYNQQKVDKHK
jgi:hypothetical protein